MPRRAWDESFGTLLARLRRGAGLTQEQLADRAELSVRAISSLECGERHPRRLTLDLLAGALELTADQRTELIAAAEQDRASQERRRGVPAPFVEPAGQLVGRADELAELNAHLHGAGPPALAYTGEYGIGKSRLLAEAMAVAIGAGLPVLAAAGQRRGDAYAPIADALAEHVRRTPPAMLTLQLRGCAGLDLVLPELADQLPALPADAAGPGAGGHDRRLAFEAVGRFMDNIAGTGRVLLVLDDAQWAGPEAAELLTYLLRRGWPRLRVVLALRDGEVEPGSALGTYAADLARLRLIRGRRLAPLTAHDAEALVTLTAGDTPLPAAARARILRRAGGLPLFLVDLAQAARTGVEDVPWHLRLALVHQLATLPEPVVRLLRRMAVAGPSSAAEELAGLHSPVEEVLDLLDVARRHGILDETRHGFRFRYPLMREMLAVGLGPNRSRLWRPDPSRTRREEPFGTRGIRRGAVVVAAAAALLTSATEASASVRSAATHLGTATTVSAPLALPEASPSALPSYDTWIADVTAAIATAAQYLRTRLPDATTKTAIVLDIDNTAVETGYSSNIVYPATKPVLELALQASNAGAAVFFVTARPEIIQPLTDYNLRSVGYPIDGMYLRPTFDFKSDQSLKTNARIAIERLGYTIVANVGNNDTDLAGGHAERTFKLPDYGGQLS
jgi:transcriptional regulator with XRE-family HTH domain